DYTNNRAIVVTGPLDNPGRARVEESGQQPLPSPEEVAAAIEIVSGHPELGPPIKDGLLVPYPAMPPLVQWERPDGRVERTLGSGLLPAERARAVQHEIVGVNMIRNSVERYDDYAPRTSRAVRSTCGAPPSAGQATTAKGVAGQVWITVTQG